MRAMIDDELVAAHRARGLTPDHPCSAARRRIPTSSSRRRETVNPFYLAAPGIVQKAMDKFAALTGRQYHLFDYVGAPDAERVIVLMGSGGEAAQETVEYLNAAGREGRRAQGAPVPALLGRALRRRAAGDGQGHRRAGPHQGTRRRRRAALPGRRHRPGRSAGQGAAAAMPRVIGGRYGLSSKEFTPAMVKAVFDELAKAKPKNHFTVGIVDDVTHTSLDLRSRLQHRARRRGARACSSAWAPTARWAPTRTRSRSSARRRELRPGLLRLRLEEVRRASPSRTCASARARSTART